MSPRPKPGDVQPDSADARAFFDAVANPPACLKATFVNALME